MTRPYNDRLKQDFFMGKKTKKFFKKICYKKFIRRCIFHGDLRQSCHITPPNTNRDTKNFKNESFGELNDKFNRQKTQLLNMECNVVVIYECDFLNERRTHNNQTDAAIRANCYVQNPALNNALIPR